MFTTRSRNFLVVALAVSVTASGAFAQSAGQTPKKPAGEPGAGARSAKGDGQGRPAKGGQRGGMADGLMQRLTSELKLTEEQQQQIRTVVQAHFDAVRQQNENSEEGQQAKAIREEMRKAREAGDQDKLEQLRKQLRELGGDDRGARREQMQQNMQELRAKITPLLTAEQQKQFAEMKFERPQGGGPGGMVDPRRLRGILQNLDLSKEQKASAEEIFAKAKEEMQSIPEDDRAARAQLAQRTLGDIRNLLTEEQRTKLEEQLAQQRTRGEGKGAGNGDGQGRGGAHDKGAAGADGGAK